MLVVHRGWHRVQDVFVSTLRMLSRRATDTAHTNESISHGLIPGTYMFHKVVDSFRMRSYWLSTFRRTFRIPHVQDLPMSVDARAIRSTSSLWGVCGAQIFHERRMLLFTPLSASRCRFLCLRSKNAGVCCDRGKLPMSKNGLSI